MAPWADALYAMDAPWWKVHGKEAASFAGERLSFGYWHAARKAHVDYSTRNSGAGAIALAASRGARRVILLGYDCQHTGGRTHWHGDHPKGCAGNAGRSTMKKWPKQFRDLAAQVGGVEIINASRETALTVFPRVPLEKALC